MSVDAAPPHTVGKERRRPQRSSPQKPFPGWAETAGRVFVPTVPNVEVVKVAENGIVIKKRLEE